MAQSPLLVRMDSGLSSDDGFDSDNFDDDNNSIDSKDIEPAESRQTFRRHPTDIQISDGYETVNFGIAVKSDKPYSPDPFAINYRKTTDWDAAAKAQWQREWWFVPNLIEKYESVEHAEFTRPFDQFRVLLQERGIYEKYEYLFSHAPDAVTRSCNVMNMLLEEAPDLIVRYAALEKLMRERIADMESGKKASWELAWEKRRAAELREGRKI